MDFTGKVYIVTGASSGIGLSCAEQIISLGGQVVGADKCEAAIENEAYEHSVISVTDEKAVEDLAQKLIDLYSRRKASPGYAFPKETEWQSAFEVAFPS